MNILKLFKFEKTELRVVALEQEQLRLVQHQALLEAKIESLTASTAELTQTTATLAAQLADLKLSGQPSQWLYD